MTASRAFARAACVVLAALPLGARQSGEAPLAAPSPASVLGGLHALKTTSRIRLAAAPNDPHELQVILAFPDRARWTLRREGGEVFERRLEYRFGEHGFAIEMGTESSRALDEPEDGEVESERRAFLRRCALRQAAFLWPEGAAWTGDGETRTAAVCATTPTGAKTQDALNGSPGRMGASPVIGTLTAEIGADGRPTSISSRDAAGVLEETLSIVGWLEQEGRRYPARLRLALGDAPVWDEEVLSVEPTVRFLDRVFLPADRMALLRVLAQPLRRRIAAGAEKRLPLPEETGWEEALADARARYSAEAASGTMLAPAPWLELSDEGSPVAVVLRLSEPTSPPPAGWQRAPAADAVTMELDGLDPPSEADLVRLRAAIPADRRPASLIARIGERSLDLQVTLE